MESQKLGRYFKLLCLAAIASMYVLVAFFECKKAKFPRNKVNKENYVVA
jgi:hypothetical protein